MVEHLLTNYKLFLIIFSLLFVEDQPSIEQNTFII